MAVLSTHLSMHRVLAIPELLDMIFGFLDEASNTSNARVSKQWSEVALDRLWRDVNDLHRLFSLLAPLVERDDGDYIFTRIPDASSWAKFERYSKRVRRLSFNAVEATHPLHKSVFDDIGRTRTTLNILPSLSALNWNGPLRLCVMFMHSNVKRFTIRLPGTISLESPAPFFQDLASRMPYITHLDIRTKTPMRYFEAEAITLFRALVKLQKITLPRFHFTTKIAECVSSLENLETLEFQYHEEQGCGDPEDTMVFKPSLAEGSFPSLWDLSLTTSFNDAANFINMPFAPRNVTMLYIDSHLFESPTDILRALTIIADSCQRLKSLALYSLIEPTTTPGELFSKDNCINIKTIQPLFNCLRLTSLEFLHHYPLDLSQEDIETIATKWPFIETLLLNCEPVYLEHPSLTLEALLPFAEHCSNLRHLGLFIKASTAELPPHLLGSTYQYKPFKKLSRLSMGVSSIAEEGSVALFLSQICPLHCRLDSGVTWDDSIPVPGFLADDIKTRYERWDKVRELLPLLTKLRTEERGRARGLQSEVEDLRMRTYVLTNKATLAGGRDGCIII